MDFFEGLTYAHADFALMDGFQDQVCKTLLPCFSNNLVQQIHRPQHYCKIFILLPCVLPHLCNTFGIALNSQEGEKKG